jgi:low temperature requirement protein LtrA
LWASREPSELRLALWAAGIGCEVLTPVFALGGRRTEALPPSGATKLPERFGLFVIIVLGEAIVGVVRSAAGVAEMTLQTALVAAIAMLIVFGLWWIYFDRVAGRAARPGVQWSAVWTYLHLPLVMAIAAMGAGAVNVIARAHGAMDAGARWLMAGALGFALIALAALELAVERPERRAEARRGALLKIGAGGFALALCRWGGGLGTVALLSLLLAALIAQVVHGTYASGGEARGGVS